MISTGFMILVPLSLSLSDNNDRGIELELHLVLIRLFFTYLTYFSFICFSSRPFSPIDCMMNSHSVSVCLVVFLPSSMCTSSPSSLFSIPILCQRTCSFFSSCFHRFVVSSSRFPLPHLVPSSFFLLVVALLFLLHLSSSFFFLFPDSLFPHVLISCFKYTTERSVQG